MIGARRRGAAIGVILLLAMSAVGCSHGTRAQPRPVTTAESQLLATVRFNNFDAGSRPFSTSITEDATLLHLKGWIDYTSHLGYAAVTGASFASQALLWNATAVGVHDATPDSDGNPPLPILPASDQAWISHPLNASTSRLDALLITLSGLGSDRPDNPVLVAQSGAMWLRTDSVDGTPVTVFAAPPSDKPVDGSTTAITADTSPLRLWVNGAGLMLRAEVRIGDDWNTADFPDTVAPTLTVAKAPG